MKNPYEVLGVEKNATKEEIKKAYKKLVRQWHPDKFSTKSEKEQKEAEEKFKDINEANEILSNPEKREQFDFYGSTNSRQNQRYSSYYEDMFRRQSEAQRQRAMTGQTIQMKVPLNIEEIYNGCTKKLRFKRQVRCKSCHGVGGTSKEICPVCSGTGIRVERYTHGNAIFENHSTCHHCNGAGFSVKNVCRDCNGSGFNIDYNIVEVSFAPGVAEGDYHVHQYEGCESKEESGLNGDFVAIPIYIFDKEKYGIADLDVYEKIKVPYYDAILGSTIKLTLPNKTEIEVKLPEGTKPNDYIKKSNLGIKNTYGQGDYILIIDYDVPSKLSSNEKKALKEIKEMK